MKLNEVKIGEGEVGAGASGPGSQEQNGDPVKKAVSSTSTEKPLINGEVMSREGSQRDGAGESGEGGPTSQPTLTNGLGSLPRSTDVENMDVDTLGDGMPGKGKAKESNGNSLPSPESVAAS